MTPRTVTFDPKKILIVLHGSVGDVTRGLALGNLVRKGFPKAFLAWSVEPACYPLLQGNPAIDEILVFDRRHWWRTLRPFLAQVRAHGFDLVLDLQRHLKSGVVSWWSGAPQRIGFHRDDSKEGNWLFNNHHIERAGEQIPKLEHYLKFAEYLGIESTPIEWTFRFTADERSAVDGHLKEATKSFAVLFVGGRWQSKRWFPRQMAQCAEMLQVQHGFDVVLLGGREDQETAREAMARSDRRILNLVGRTTLREAMGIIEKARVAVGPDTGLMHIAAAVGTPVVSLWGATDPGRTGPYGFGDLVIRGRAPCVPCQRRRCAIGRICMESIATAEIAAKVNLALRLHSNSQTTDAQTG